MKVSAFGISVEMVQHHPTASLELIHVSAKFSKGAVSSTASSCLWFVHVPDSMSDGRRLCLKVLSRRCVCVCV